MTIASAFTKIRKDSLIAATAAAVRTTTEEITLIRRHGALFFVYRNDWIAGIVPAHDRDLGVPAIHRMNARVGEDSAPSSAQKLLLEVAKYGVDPVFLDVGTNYGQWVVPACRVLRQAHLTPQIVCFEPGLAASLACSNLLLNGITESELLIAAVGDIDGVVPLYVNEGHTEDNKIINRGVKDRQVPTPSVRLDSVIRELGTERDYFIKVDTQGAEWEVLNGLGEFAAGGRVTLVMEFSPKSLSSRVKPTLFLRTAAENFDIIRLDNKQNAVRLVPEVDHETFVKQIWNQKNPFCDLALISKVGKRRRTMAEGILPEEPLV